MGYAVEFAFDLESQGAIAALTDQIYRTCGGTHLTAGAAQPHISLALFDSRPTGIEPVLAALAAETAPFPVHFSAVGTFPGAQGTIYLAPVVTAELLALHSALHARLRAMNLTSQGYYRPGAWIPHCTVGLELPAAQLPQAIALCRAADLFRVVQVVAVRLIHFRPVNLLDTYPLRVI